MWDSPPDLLVDGADVGTEVAQGPRGGAPAARQGQGDRHRLAGKVFEIVGPDLPEVKLLKRTAVAELLGLVNGYVARSLTGFHFTNGYGGAARVRKRFETGEVIHSRPDPPPRPAPLRDSPRLSVTTLRGGACA